MNNTLSLYDFVYERLLELQVMLRGSTLTASEARSLIRATEDLAELIKIVTKPE